MMTASLIFGEGVARTTFELGRDLSSPWSWLAPLAVMLVLAWFVIGMYLLDCVELGGRLAVLLIGLRMLALCGVLAIYLQPQWRAERNVVDNSRVLIAVDTSQSMGQRDVPADDGPGSAAPMDSRVGQVVGELADGTLLNDLRRVHDVVVYRFDEDDKPTAVSSLAKLPPRQDNVAATAEQQAARQTDLQRLRTQLAVAGSIMLIAFGLLVWYLLRPATTGATGSGPVLASGAALAVGIGVAVWAWMGGPNVPMRQLLGLDGAAPLVTAEPSTDDVATEEPAIDEIDWAEQLTPQGGDTKLGQAVYQLVVDERATPVSAIIVFSDGQRTAGLEVEEAAETARDAGLPVFAIGLGSLQVPQFVRLADFAAPARAYQGDPFEITGFLSSQGLAGRTAVVTLRQVSDAEATQQEAEDTGLAYDVETTLGADAEDVVPVVFDVESFDKPGRYAFELDVALKGGKATSSDNRRRFYIDVVDRQTRVLLVSGGPSREYQFLRNLLVRDKNIDVHVLLQSKLSDKIDDPDFLTDFPESGAELNKYDAMIAIDPDWDKLGASRAALVERWVSEEAGGLIVVPGVVNTGSVVKSWISDPEFDVLHRLYPVEFHRQFERLGGKQSGSKTAWPIELTRAGMEADFLRLDDNPAESHRRWSEFAGVFGGYPVKAKRLGTTVYATFGDTMAESQGYDPIYLAGHFYGNGRVFYIGSGEMWRLRMLDDSYFEQLYTRLVRHVTMGRLHRGSTRGDVLLLEKEQYQVGETVQVIAQLKDAQRQPLAVDSVTMFVFDPSEKGSPILLKRDAARPGTYRGEFVVREAKDYRLELPLTDSDEDPLSKVIKVIASEREKRQPQQNDQVLKALAETSGGRYYGSVSAAMGRSDDPPLVPSLEDETRITPVAGDIDPIWKEAWSKWMMFGVCGVLCLEWLLRRLFKLA